MSSRLQRLSNRRDRSIHPMRIIRASAPVAVAILGSIWIAGCDTAANQADRKVQADVAKAQAALERGDMASADDARRMLESAAASTDATAQTRAYAKSSLARVEQNTASEIMRKIDENDGKLDQLVYEISQLAQQVDASRAIAASYDKYDPKPAHDAIAAEIAAAQGGPDKLVWFKQDNTSAPSLTAVKQTISQLQGQLAKQADELKSLQDQRTQTLDEADQADKSSEIAKGQQSVDEFKRSADLKKHAGELTVQIEKNQAQTVPIQKDLAVAQGQQVVLEKLLQEFQDENASLDTGWKSVQDAVTSQATLQKEIVGTSGDPVPAPANGSIISPTAGLSLSAKSDALGALVKEIAAERTDALSNLNNAIQHYRDAANAGQDFYATLDTKIKDPANALKPEQDAWKNLQAVNAPAVYRIQEAIAQRQLAELYVSALDNDIRRTQLQDEVSKILGAVNIPVPAALADAGLDDDRKASAASATTAYDAATKEVTDLTTGNPPEPLKNLAKLQSILTLYGQVQLDRANGDSSGAQEKLLLTTTARDDAIAAGLQLPPLPSEITPPAAPKVPATPAPGT